LSRSDTRQRATAGGEDAVGRDGLGSVVRKCRRQAERYGERLDKAMHPVMGAASLLVEPS
jgi:hypothetical protein